MDNTTVVSNTVVVSIPAGDAFDLRFLTNKLGLGVAITIATLTIAMIVAQPWTVIPVIGGAWAVLAIRLEQRRHRYRETLSARADAEHAAIMRGDLEFGTYGQYPPAV